MANSADSILWIYIVLLVAGGLVGFLKGKSKMSLIMSLAFALPLSLSLIMAWPTLVSFSLLAFLSLFFGMRFMKSKKLMPAGMMTILSVVTLALRSTLS